MLWVWFEEKKIRAFKNGRIVFIGLVKHFRAAGTEGAAVEGREIARR